MYSSKVGSTKNARARVPDSEHHQNTGLTAKGTSTTLCAHQNTLFTLAFASNAYLRCVARCHIKNKCGVRCVRWRPADHGEKEAAFHEREHRGGHQQRRGAVRAVRRLQTPTVDVVGRASSDFRQQSKMNRRDVRTCLLDAGLFHSSSGSSRREEGILLPQPLGSNFLERPTNALEIEIREPLLLATRKNRGLR